MSTYLWIYSDIETCWFQPATEASFRMAWFSTTEALALRRVAQSQPVETGPVDTAWCGAPRVLNELRRTLAKVMVGVDGKWWKNITEYII